MIRPAKAFAPLLAACALSACASPDTWQVVGIATEPGLPTSVAGTSNFQLRGDHLRGATPCAEVEGSASLADATEVMDKDPYVAAGALKARDVHEWNPVSNIFAPGQ